MAIYTPRGLKIRISVPCAFALMTRLHPKVTPFRILKTTEGIESLPGMLTLIAGLVTFALHLPPIQIAMVVVLSYLAGFLINALGLYIVPGLVGLGTLYSYIDGYGIYLIVVVITGYVLGGWQAVAAYFIGSIMAAVIGHFLEFWKIRRYYKLTGHPLTGSEVSFFNAYRLHASRNDITTDIDLSDDEMKEDYWGSTFQQFVTDWPEVVRRFTDD